MLTKSIRLSAVNNISGYIGWNLSNTPYFYGASGGNFINPRVIKASSAIGRYDGNDSGTLKPEQPNLGHYENGLLNGEGLDFDGTEFVPMTKWTDIPGNSASLDPGWIYLGKATPGSATHGSSIEYDDVLEFDIDKVLSLTFTWGSDNKSGTWELAVDPYMMEKAVALLGPSTFDHLAFVMKAGKDDEAGGGFAVYDFNFKDIFNLFPGEGLNFETAYVLSGTFTNLDFFTTKEINGITTHNYKEISHISIWAHDPPGDSAVPEPATMALVGMGLIALAGIGRKRYKRE